MKKLFYQISESLMRRLVAILLKIGAISFKSGGEPYTWASGMKMRNYNDNRKLLSEYAYRWLIARCFKIILGRKKFDYFLAIPTAGIAPAVSAGMIRNKPVIIKTSKGYMYYPTDLWNTLSVNPNKDIDRYKKIIEDDDINIILTYGKEMIPYGVTLANLTKKPFGYIREKPKDHGLENKVEGILPSKIRTIVIYDANEVSKKDILEGFPEDTFAIFVNIADLKVKNPRTVDFTKKPKAVGVEDLASTGGSSAKEINDFREAGGECNLCIVIYNYGLETCKNQFAGIEPITKTNKLLDPPCELRSILTFEQLHKEMTRIDHFAPEVLKAMKAEIDGFDGAYKEMVQQSY